VKRVLLLVAVLALAAPGLLAHEVRPGYLEIRQANAEAFHVLHPDRCVGAD
jgi:hypothetical protein